MSLDLITPLILTYNEENNIGRVLEKLSWARRVVVVDSGSTDATLSIVAGHPQAEVVNRAFDTFANQCNFGLTQIHTEWALSLDADYVLSEQFVTEIGTLNLEEACGYSARFVYMIYGRPLRGTLYPPRTVLYKASLARYHDEGHGHRVQIQGPIKPLSGVIFHDDRKPLSRWFSSQQSYARREAQYLLSREAGAKRLTDRIRRLAWPAPFLVFVYTLIAKHCIFDGWRGWFYVLQRVVAECMIAIELIDQRHGGQSR